MRRAADCDVGDTVRVELDFDASVRAQPVPELLAQRMSKNAAARRAFELLTPSRRKEIPNYLKQSEDAGVAGTEYRTRNWTIGEVKVALRRLIQPILLFSATLLMFFSAVVTATISVPHLREDMLEINVRPTLLGAIMIGLHFGSFAMVAFSLITLVAAGKSVRGQAFDKISVRIVGAVYLCFGIVSFISTGSHHTLGYVLIGALLFAAIATTSQMQS